MSSDDVNKGRRRFLVATTSAAGVIGLVISPYNFFDDSSLMIGVGPKGAV